MLFLLYPIYSELHQNWDSNADDIVPTVNHINRLVRAGMIFNRFVR